MIVQSPFAIGAAGLAVHPDGKIVVGRKSTYCRGVVSMNKKVDWVERHLFGNVTDIVIAALERAKAPGASVRVDDLSDKLTFVKLIYLTLVYFILFIPINIDIYSLHCSMNIISAAHMDIILVCEVLIIVLATMLFSAGSSMRYVCHVKRCAPICGRINYAPVIVYAIMPFSACVYDVYKFFLLIRYDLLTFITYDSLASADICTPLSRAELFQFSLAPVVCAMWIYFTASVLFYLFIIHRHRG